MLILFAKQKINLDLKWEHTEHLCKNWIFSFFSLFFQQPKIFRWGRGPHNGTSGGHHPAVIDYRTGYIRSHLRSPSGRVRWLNTHFRRASQSIKRCQKPISWINDLHENIPTYQLIDWSIDQIEIMWIRQC